MAVERSLNGHFAFAAVMPEAYTGSTRLNFLYCISIKLEKPMRVGVVLIAVMMLGLASCRKATHRAIASKGEGTVWTIDEMVYSASDDGTLLLDTLLFDVGRFEFRVEKSRYQHGLGTVYRREHQNGAWTAEIQEEFSWSSNEDLVEVTYESGLSESITVIESRRNDQHWQSSVTVGTNIYTRSYFLSKSFD